MNETKSQFLQIFEPLKQDGVFRTFTIIVAGLFLIVTCILFIFYCFGFLDFYELLNSFLVNLLAAIFFYLIGSMSETRRRQIAKNNLREQYREFKDGVTSILISSAGETYNLDTLQQLRDINNFRDYFNQPSEDDERNIKWYDVLNGLEESRYYLQRLVIELRIFRDHLSLTLNTIEIRDRRIFIFFTQLSRQIYILEQGDRQNDEIKDLSHFLWQVFTGWSWIDGYPEEDIIEVLIMKI